jgi:CubicO group peptidase (beta-lactamase class C family)
MTLPHSRRLVRLSACLIGITLLAPAPCALAQGSNAGLVAALDATVRDWMQAHQVPAASVAAMKDKSVVGSFGYGGMHPAKPARIASLSKAITAVCIARLIDEGRLSFTTPLGTVLAGPFKQLGQPVDPRFKSITIEQLLTHRAGLAREARGGPPVHDMAGTFTRVLATPLENDPGGGMAYSNIGYLTLGMVTQTVTGRDYERHCGATALAPMQASGFIDPLLRQRAPNGGWRVSAIDYAKFIQVFEPSAGALGKTSSAWQQGLDGNPIYGLGTFLRRTAQGVMFWHSGRTALRERSGAYTIKFDNGWTTVVMFEGDPRGSVADLRRRLTAAVRAPNTAPTIDGSEH